MTQKESEGARAQPSTRRAEPRDEARWKHRWMAGAAGIAALAGSAIFNRARARRAEAASPPAGSFIEVDSVRLHYVDRGSGTPLVLLHGNGVTLQDYKVSGVLDLASEKYRVIAFDRPGFGYSERPRTTIWTPAAQARLLANALRRLGVGPAVIVGHSWGTLVALAMALDEPHTTSGLLLLSGYYYGTARPDVWPFSLPAVPFLGDLMANTVSPLVGRLLAPATIKAAFWPAPISKKFARFPLDLTLRPAQLRATAEDTAIMVPAAIEISRRYRGLTCPTILMAGEGDVVVRVDKHAQRFVREVQRAELRMVPEQGHLFHYAVPEQVIAALDDVAARAAS